MEPLLLIYNPTAGKGQLPDELAAVLDEFTKANWLVTAYPTQGRGTPSGRPGAGAPLLPPGVRRRGRHPQRDGHRSDAAGGPAHPGLYPFRLHQRLRR